MSWDKDTIFRGLTQSFWKMVTIGLLLFSSLQMLERLHPTWKLRQKTIVGLLLIMAVYVLIYELVIPLFKKRMLTISLVAQMLFFLGGMIYYQTHKVAIQQSIIQLYNDVLPRWNSQYGTNYWPIVTETGAEVALAFFVVIVLIGSFLYQEIIGARGALFALPAGIIGVSVVINDLFSFKMYIPVLLAAILFYSQSWNGHRVSLRKKGKTSKRTYLHQQLPQVVVLVIGLVLIILVSGATTPYAKKMAAKMDSAIEIQRELEAAIKKLKPMSMQWVDSSVTNTAPEYSKKEIMEMSASKFPDDNLYLATYYGAQYQNGSWVEDTEEFAEACKAAGYTPIEVMEVINNRAYKMLMRYEAISGTSVEGINWIDYRISYKGMSGTTAVKPYFTTNTMPNRVTLQESGLWEKSLLQGSQSYTALSRNERYTDLIYTTLFEDGIASREDEIEEWYRSYVMEYYTRPLEGVPELRNAEVDEYMDYLSIPDTEFAQSVNAYRCNVAEVLALVFTSANYKYSLSLDKLEPGVDPVAYFMQESKEGFCMHFASAAVSQLRAYGIPARFVGGYIVKRNSFKLAGVDYKASIKDSNAHAWLEIYLDGIGWIPYEFTSGYSSPGSMLPVEEEPREEPESESEAVSETEQEASEELPKPSEQEKPSESQSESEKESEEKGNSEKGDGAGSGTNKEDPPFVLVGFVICLVAGIFVILVVESKKKQSAKKLQNAIRDKKNRRAVKMMNRRLYWHLCKKGKVRHLNMREAEYRSLLESQYSELDVEEFLRIAQKAMFSRETITNDEVKYFYREYKKTRN